MQQYKKSFSLIELMVVIAIIGVLAAIAVPSYKNYTIKAKIAVGFPILQNALKTVIQGYEQNGDFPNILSIYGISVTRTSPGWVATINSPPIVGIHYNTSANSAWVCLYYADLGISGYVAWNGSDPNGGIATRLCMKTVFINNLYRNYCGRFNTSSDIGTTASQYLPANCQTYLPGVPLS